jgi:dihydroxy-acid dehydratase
MELNKYSKTTQDETQPAAQAMLYGIGLTERFKKSTSRNC